MNNGSIMFWFMPCRMKVPGMYGFQMSGAGMLTFKGMTRISLRATSPLALAAGAAVAAGSAGARFAAGAAGALVGASLAGGPPQATNSTIMRISVPNHRLRILVFLSTKNLRVVWMVCDHPRAFLGSSGITVGNRYPQIS